MILGHKPLFVVFREGRIKTDECLNRTVFCRKRDFSAQKIKDLMFSLTTACANMSWLIKNLKAIYQLKKIPVSNEIKELNEYRIYTFRLNDFINFFLPSRYIQLRKTEPAVFRLALNVAQGPENEIVYIGDQEMFTQVASERGIKIIYQQYNLCLM